MTAMLGGLLGWGLSYIGQPDIDKLRFESRFYRTLNQKLPLIGAGLGLAVGYGFAVIRQKQKERDRNSDF